MITCVAFLVGTHSGVLGDQQLKVSPADELLVIDPGVDSARRPTPIFHGGATGTKIEIPPTVVVHRYYYSGNRDFQGPMLPGGPTVIVANHPITGEQVQLNAQLMPGAPRIRYSKHAITYDYGDRCISVEFGLASFCQPKVVYHRDTGLRRHLAATAQRSAGVATEFVSRAQIPESILWWRRKKSDAVLSLGDHIGETKGRIADVTKRAVNRTPLRGLIEPAPVEAPSLLSNGSRTGIVQELRNTVTTNR